MGFGVGFNLSRSGLDGAQRALDAIGHNIANAQTVGFKAERVRFVDAFAAGVAGEAAAAGVATPTIQHEHGKQGGMQTTNNPLDMAIMGTGFFRLEDPEGTIAYARKGEFKLAISDAKLSTEPPRLVNDNGYAVTGYVADYTVDPQGTIAASGTPAKLSIDLNMPAKATTFARFSGNMDANATAPALPFDPQNSDTYNKRARVEVFDSVGDSHALYLHAVKDTQANVWQIYPVLDDVQGASFSLSFDSKGRLLPGIASPPMTFAVPPVPGSVIPFKEAKPGVAVGPIEPRLGSVTQFGTIGFQIDATVADGYAKGSVEGAQSFHVADDGVIWGEYSNGQSRRVAQVALATFKNSAALINAGDSMWSINGDPRMGTGKEETFVPSPATADQAVVGGYSGIASILGGAVETSNVDLANELVMMIEQQRNYQASAQTFKALDEALRNLASIR